MWGRGSTTTEANAGRSNPHWGNIHETTEQWSKVFAGRGCRRAIQGGWGNMKVKAELKRRLEAFLDEWVLREQEMGGYLL